MGSALRQGVCVCVRVSVCACVCVCPDTGRHSKLNHASTNSAGYAFELRLALTQIITKLLFFVCLCAQALTEESMLRDVHLIKQSTLFMHTCVCALCAQALTEESMLRDIHLIKQANLNAVRCSHYPNHNRWCVPFCLIFTSRFHPFFIHCGDLHALLLLRLSGLCSTLPVLSVLLFVAECTQLRLINTQV